MNIELTRKQIIESEFTIECPTCDYILIGFEPRYFIECDECIKKAASIHSEEGL